LRILPLATEAAPFAKAGGLADVVQGLADQLAASGHDVRVLLPDYRLDGDHALREPVTDWQRIELGGRTLQYRFTRWPTATGKAPYFLLDCPELFAHGRVYAGGDDELLRYVFLCRSAALLCDHADWRPEILHCHDWHASLLVARAAAGLETEGPLGDAAAVLTIHNIGYQGAFPAAALAARGADAVTTVSPTYAKEILTPEFGMGLEPDLVARSGDLTGILNGADYAVWDPSRDELIASRYDATAPAGKQACRESLLQTMKLDVAPDVPVAGVVSRLVEHKGIDLVLAAAPELIANGRLGLAVLGDGDPVLARELGELATRFPGRVAFVRGYDDPLAHRIIAGSDLLLVPSRYEPCGLTQMYALRYGTVPVARRTGGLADTVTHFDPDGGTGNGSVFLDADPAGLRWALDSALEWFADPAVWRRLQQNGFAADFGWPRQAGEYVVLYQRLRGLAA